MQGQSEKGFAAILVILVVLAAGTVGAYFLYTKNSSNLPFQNPPAKTLALTLQSPTDGTLATDGQVAIKGQTAPNTTVVFYTDTAENSVESDASGNFEGNLELANGINTLTVTAFGEDGNEKSTTLDVVYDNE